MKLNSKDRKKINSFYDNLIQEFGLEDPRSLCWNNEESRRIREDILYQIIPDIQGKRVLDVGCGVGDFYSYLKNKVGRINYKGIDINHNFIDFAKKRFPESDFEKKEVGEIEEKFDIVFSSGCLSFKIPGYKDFYFDMVEKMFQLSKTAVGFNMLNKKNHTNDELFAAYSVPEVYLFRLGLTDKMTIRHDYLDYDFTVFLYH